jgi:hypothetical protein
MILGHACCLLRILVILSYHIVIESAIKECEYPLAKMWKLTKVVDDGNILYCGWKISAEYGTMIKTRIYGCFIVQITDLWRHI